MKAMVCTKYGPPEVLQLQELEKPTPKKHEVLIKICATAVTASDCIIRGFKVSRKYRLPMGLVIGFTKPRQPILGLVLAGEVEAVGKDVRRFEKGNQVYAMNIIRFGMYAEYTCLPENSVLAVKPSNATYEEATAVPFGGLLALHFLRKGHIQSGQHVLIYGASGAVGTAAVQLARYFGATVTGVCSTTNVALVQSLGAEQVIDYTKEDSTNSSERYDLIFDAVGKAKSSSLKLQCKTALTPNGTYLSVDDGRPAVRTEGLLFLKELMEAGKLKAVIDRRYPLEQLAEAHRYVETGHKKGNVVIIVAKNSSPWQGVGVDSGEPSFL
ncbi:MAG TPA: NAD(P)-dependent alcohol dehydrogenase [Ktedonobacterales bacterium]